MTRSVKWRWLLLALSAIAAAIQFVPVDRSNRPPRAEIDAPPAVMGVLRAACYDCHSSETRWPWYAYVAPASWLLAGHVERGRGEFNLSDWELLDPLERLALRREMWKNVESGEMPLPAYARVHAEARLTDEQKRTLREWAEAAEGPRPFEVQERPAVGQPMEVE